LRFDIIRSSNGVPIILVQRGLEVRSQKIAGALNAGGVLV